MPWEDTPSPLAQVKVLMFRDDVLVRLHRFDPGVCEIPTSTVSGNFATFSKANSS